MDPGIASFEPRTPNVRPPISGKLVSTTLSLPRGHQSRKSNLICERREGRGGGGVTSFFRLQITTGNGDNKIRKDTALITKQHENERTVSLSWETSEHTTLNRFSMQGRKEGGAYTSSFLFEFMRIGKCQKVHSSLQCEGGATCPRPRLTAPTSDSQTQTQAPPSSPSLPSEKLKERGQMHPSSTLAPSLVRRTDRYKEQPQSAIEVKCISVCVFAGCPHGIIRTE